MKRFCLFLLSTFILSCSPGKPEPEEVLRDFLMSMAAGNCERAKTLTEGSALYFVNENIYAGCEAYEREIIKITCRIEDEKAYCDCTERYDPDPDEDITIHWSLKRKDGEWKVTSMGEEVEWTKHVGH